MGDPERADRLRPLPRRLQHQRDDARGQGQAHPLAQPPRGRRGLALRQGPLRLLAPARRRPHRRIRSRKTGRAASRRSRGTKRSTRPSACSATPARRSSPRSRAARRSSRPTGSASCSGSGSAPTTPCCPEDVPDALDAFRAPLSSIRDAKTVVVPLRRARRRARAGRRPLDQGRTPGRRRDPMRAARRAPSTGPSCHRRPADRSLARRRAAKPTAAFYLPRTPNGRGVADAWSCAADGEPGDERAEAARRSPATRPPPIPRVRALAEQPRR